MTGRSIRGDRGQSNVVGVALLVGLTMLSLGALTATVGTVVDSNAAVGDVDRVATDLEAAIEPVETTGTNAGRVTFTEGTLRTDTRTVRVLRDGDTVVTRETGAVVYDRGEYGVTAVAGAVVRNHPGSASLAAAPPVSVSDTVVVIGVADVRIDDVTVDGSGSVTRTLTTEVAHDRVLESEQGEWGVAVETPTPDPWRREFQGPNTTVTVERFDGDEHASVVATFEGERTGHVVVHRVDVGVTRG